MRVKFNFENGLLTISLIGELDEHYAKGAKEYIDELIAENKLAKQVVFDMSGLKFMDSTGIGMMLGRYKKLKKLEIPCFLKNPTPSVEKVIELSGIYEVMPKM